MERRHNCDIKDLQERAKIEKQAWEENILRRQEASTLSKEREIREQLKKERDKVRVWLGYVLEQLNILRVCMHVCVYHCHSHMVS